MKTYKTYSSEKTKALGKEFAEKVKYLSAKIQKSRVGALVFALSGDLGSGKTTFAQGFLRGLGIKKRSQSPTFVLFRRFAIRHLPFANAYHVDVYRLKKSSELIPLGFKEVLSDPKNVVLIEWADKIKRVLPKSTLWIRFSHGKKENERIIKSSL